MVLTQHTGLHITLRRRLRNVIKTSQAVMLLVGCMHAKAHVQGEFIVKKVHSQNPRGLSIPNAKSKAVLLFLHGSMVEKIDDTCDPDGDSQGFSVPDVVRQLSGAQVSGLEVLVVAPCHGRATHLGEPLKIDQRVAAIEQTLLELTQAGVDPVRIFLVGQSAGGWAALLHQKRYPGSVNSTIAFAPAFAGPKRWRPDVWQQRHEAQRAEILSAKHIAALVFAFENDAYNSPEDLAFLAQIQGTTLLRMPEKSIEGVACEIPWFGSSHGQAYRKCFGQTQSGVLLNFIRQRLPTEGVLSTDATDASSVEMVPASHQAPPN